ncbi:MAG TPA: hypothetical protein VFZ07_02890 [Dongiaceae bacterium]
MPIAPRLQQAAAPAVDREAASSGFIGAIFGSVIRWAIFAAIMGAIAVFIISGQEELEESVGETVLYAIWYLAAVAVPAMQPEMASAIDANGIYSALKPHAGLLPFLVPLAFGAVVTILFLPTVNARRRASGLRFLVFLANLALVWFAWRANFGIFDLTGTKDWIDTDSINLSPVIAWLVLLLISFLGRRRWQRAPAKPQNLARPAPVSAGIAAARKPSHAASAATRHVSPAQRMPQRRSNSPIERSVSGGTWRRPR